MTFYAGTPKLIEIDLTKGDKHEHPDFDENGYYLVKFSDRWYFGQPQRVWFGWHFACGFGVCGGFQFDAPGSNHSSWEKMYEIKGLE